MGFRELIKAKLIDDRELKWLREKIQELENISSNLSNHDEPIAQNSAEDIADIIKELKEQFT